MIFINHMKSAKAAKDYYSQHIAPGDYYSKDAAEMKGIWHGLAAEKLGLSGDVKQQDVFILCDNLDPMTKKQLTPRMKDDRRVVTDFTYDAPKSVTLAYELGGDERRHSHYTWSGETADAQKDSPGRITRATSGSTAEPSKGCC
jgi:conjugative relaxase-like TrwC/TraI family protein